MALTKICGIETEYGIVWRGVEQPDPIAASSILISSYIDSLRDTHAGSGEAPSFSWDFSDEQPGNDARGFAPLGALPPEIESQLTNTVLTNGARYYVDHAHPELTTPECTNARDVVLFDRAAESILQRSMVAADRNLPPGQELVIYKNNSDGKGNSYGCHENYLIDRAVPFGEIVGHLTPHFITRQIFCGAGKVGSELGIAPDRVPFQLSQRADFFEEEVGLETTLKRPIINTRDEPHADPAKYRRRHVIIGDANMSEVATFLKVGTTALVLAMLEDGALPERFQFAQPIRTLRAVSQDLTLRATHRLVDGSSVTALAVQWELLTAADRHAERGGLEFVGGEVGHEILRRWEQTLTGLESDPMSLATTVDWVAKHRLIDGYRERHGLHWGDARLAALDLQYHDLRPERSLSSRVGLERIVDPSEIERAVSQPPDDSRAFFRGRCLQKFSGEIISANWDSIVFDTGEKALKRVPMMEPTRGTRDDVARLIDDCHTAAELVARLQGNELT